MWLAASTTPPSAGMCSPPDQRRLVSASSTGSATARRSRTPSPGAASACVGIATGPLSRLLSRLTAHHREVTAHSMPHRHAARRGRPPRVLGRTWQDRRSMTSRHRPPTRRQVRRAGAREADRPSPSPGSAALGDRARARPGARLRRGHRRGRAGLPRGGAGAGGDRRPPCWPRRLAELGADVIPDGAERPQRHARAGRRGDAPARPATCGLVALCADLPALRPDGAGRGPGGGRPGPDVVRRRPGADRYDGRRRARRSTTFRPGLRTGLAPSAPRRRCARGGRGRRTRRCGATSTTRTTWRRRSSSGSARGRRW